MPDGPHLRRRVLVVAYFFPPLGGVGVQRTLRWIVHLARLGWDAVVITPKDASYPLRDPALLDEIPASTTVVRTLAPEPIALPATILARLRRSRLRRSTTGRSSDAASTDRSGPPDVGARVVPRARAGGRRPSAAHTVATHVLATWARAWRWMLFPDDLRLWVRFAVRAGVGAHRHRPVDVILSSSPPVSAHLAAAAIAQRTGRPWVADFRDPWVGNAFAAPVSPARATRMADAEARIVRSADRVVVASPSMARDFAARHPGREARVVYIPNGYDREEIARITPRARADDLYHLVYAGSVYGAHELELFLDGLELLLRERPPLRERLRVDFVGRLNDASARLATARSRPERLGDVVTYLGFVPRREALAWVAGADGLLHLIGPEDGKDRVVGAKLVEYLGFDRPILAVVPEGDARAILTELGVGVVADPDPRSIADALGRLVDTPPEQRVADPDGVFDRAHLAARLAAILDEVVSESGRSPARAPSPRVVG